MMKMRSMFSIISGGDGDTIRVARLLRNSLRMPKAVDEV